MVFDGPTHTVMFSFSCQKSLGLQNFSQIFATIVTWQSLIGEVKIISLCVSND